MKVIEGKIVVLGSQETQISQPADMAYLHYPGYCLEELFYFKAGAQVTDLSGASHCLPCWSPTPAPSKGVGKTSLVVRYIGKMFSRNISPTIGASFFTCNINLGDTRVKLQVWDTAGQERFRSMAPMYYRNANAALLVYDVSSEASFREVKAWVKELQSNVTENLVLSVVGNKSDLTRKVDAATAVHYASSIGAQHYHTSALHDQGIEEVFENTARALLHLHEGGEASLRSYRSLPSSHEPPVGAASELTATHDGREEVPAWSIASIAHGEPDANYCC